MKREQEQSLPQCQRFRVVWCNPWSLDPPCRWRPFLIAFHYARTLCSMWNNPDCHTRNVRTHHNHHRTPLLPAVIRSGTPTRQREHLLKRKGNLENLRTRSNIYYCYCWRLAYGFKMEQCSRPCRILVNLYLTKPDTNIYVCFGVPYSQWYSDVSLH